MSLPTWMSKLANGLLQAREGQRDPLLPVAPSVRSVPKDASVSVAPAGWTAPTGEPMHGRWKGFNAAIWWPLKEQELSLSIDSIDKDSVTGRSGQAVYSFWRSELEKFVSSKELSESRMAKREAGLPGSLYVHMKDYKIVGAGIVRENGNQKKDIA